MKHHNLYLILLCLLALGCTTKQQYQTLEGLSISVDAALDIYLAEYSLGHVSPQNHAKVLVIEQEYRRVMNAALDSLEGGGLATGDTLLIATELLAIITQLTGPLP